MVTVCVCVCVFQGVEGASAAAHALSLPAEAYGNDVSDVSSLYIRLTNSYKLIHIPKIEKIDHIVYKCK